MSKAIKLTQQQLRSIIQEAIQRKPLGEAEEYRGQDEGLAPDVARLAANHFDEYWDNAYDENDPSQAALGRETWVLQVQEASNELIEDIVASVEKVQNKLINGEYHRG
jgi:hypothetical protein